MWLWRLESTIWQYSNNLAYNNKSQKSLISDGPRSHYHESAQKDQRANFNNSPQVIVKKLTNVPTRIFFNYLKGHESWYHFFLYHSWRTSLFPPAYTVDHSHWVQHFRLIALIQTLLLFIWVRCWNTTHCRIYWSSSLLFPPFRKPKFTVLGPPLIQNSLSFLLETSTSTFVASPWGSKYLSLPEQRRLKLVALYGEENDSGFRRSTICKLTSTWRTVPFYRRLTCITTGNKTQSSWPPRSWQGSAWLNYL